MKKILYVQTSGTDTPERTYAPFILATTAAASGVDASIYFMINGLTIVKKGAAQEVQLGSFPPLSEAMAQAADAGVKFYVCEQSAQLMGFGKGDFIDGAIIAGAATLNKMAIEADGVLTL